MLMAIVAVVATEIGGDGAAMIVGVIAIVLMDVAVAVVAGTTEIGGDGAAMIVAIVLMDVAAAEQPLSK